MSIKAVGYPVIVDVGSDDGAVYSIFIDDDLIFTGRSVDRLVDIAPILRDYINSERIIIDWPATAGLSGTTEQLSAGIAIITGVQDTNRSARIYVDIDSEIVTDPTDGDHVVLDIGDEANNLHVANDYNEDCQTDFAGYPYITSEFVRNEVDRRQILFLGANTTQASMTFAVTINGDTANGYVKTFNNPSVILRTTLGIPEESAAVAFTVSNDPHGVWDRRDLALLKCSRSRYALYAVNRRGGVTHLLMEGVPLQSYSRTDWDITTNYDRLSQTGRGVRRMATTVTRKWRLNTGLLTEDESAMIDDIVLSPRIVLHDLEAGRLFAVNSSDKNIERRTRRSNRNKPIEYTLNFEEARTETRR